MDIQIQNNIHIEFVLKRTEVLKSAAPEVQAVVESYKHFESDERVVFTVPSLWEGFKDGTVAKILQAFGDFLYYALAYITADQRDIVTDFLGGPVDCYDIMVDSRRMKKFVKKRLRIMRILDPQTGTFELTGYMIDMRMHALSVPVVKVLDMFSVGIESGVGYSAFVQKSIFDEWSRVKKGGAG